MASIITILLPLLLLLSQSSAAPDLATACSTTKYPDVCTATFGSDPRSAKAGTTAELARIGLELSLTKANEAAAYTSDLVQKGKDYLEWAKYSACKSFYSTTPGSIASGLKLFDQKDYKGAIQSVAAFNSAAVQCNNLDVPVLGETNGLVIRFSDDLITIIHSLL